MKSPHPKEAVVGLLLIPARADQEVLSLGHQQGGVVFLKTFLETNTENVSGAVTGNIP